MVVPKLSTAVFTSLGFPISISTSDEKAAFDEEKASLYAKGLSSSVQALGEGSEEDQAFAWDTIFAFTARMIECGQHYSQEWRGVQKPLVNGECEYCDWKVSDLVAWNRLKAAQTAFTTVEWPAVELLLQPTCPQSARERCSLAALIVATLSKFSILSDEPDTHLESYEKVLYGCLDIIAAEGGSRIVNRLFKDLHQPPVSDSLAAFILVVAEQLVHVMDGPSLRDIAFPLAER